jgi:O-antigen ligase
MDQPASLGQSSMSDMAVARERLDAFRTSKFWFVGADALGALSALVLPFSTSIFLILLVPLLTIICGSLNVQTFVRSIGRLPSISSLVFFVLAAVGISWSEAGVPDGIRALSPMVKFLAFPFLLYYFERSERGYWVLGTFLVSCTILLLYSWIIVFEPALALKTGRCCGEDYGVPVRNYIDQGQEFSVCFVALVSAALFFLKDRIWKWSVLAMASAAGFAANLLFVVTSRTALVCIPVMLAFVALRHGGFRSILKMTALGIIIVTATWLASPHLRARVHSVYSQFVEYRDNDVPSSVGKRLEFWRKSIGFFREAPLIGHGTGSVLQLFQQAAVNHTGVSAEVIANPHNQTFNVAIQWGILGVIALYALWALHLRMFLSSGFIAEMGLIIIVQNITGSLFNSHLADFTEGWLYVLGVAAAGGILAKERCDRGSLPDRAENSKVAELNSSRSREIEAAG